MRIVVHAYYFISPVPYDELDTLCNRARNCHNVDEFFAEQVTNQSLRKWMSHCEIEFHETGTSLVHLLSRCYFELEPMGEEHRRGLESLISLLFVEDTTHSTTTIGHRRNKVVSVILVAQNMLFGLLKYRMAI